MVCLTVELNRAVTFARRADGLVMTDLELFDPSEETRFIGSLFSASKSYPLMMMRHKCEAHTS